MDLTVHGSHRFAWLVAGGAECAFCGAYWLDAEAFRPCTLITFLSVVIIQASIHQGYPMFGQQGLQVRR